MMKNEEQGRDGAIDEADGPSVGLVQLYETIIQPIIARREENSPPKNDVSQREMAIICLKFFQEAKLGNKDLRFYQVRTPNIRDSDGLEECNTIPAIAFSAQGWRRFEDHLLMWEEFFAAQTIIDFCIRCKWRRIFNSAVDHARKLQAARDAEISSNPVVPGDGSAEKQGGESPKRGKEPHTSSKSTKTFKLPPAISTTRGDNPSEVFSRGSYHFNRHTRKLNLLYTEVLDFMSKPDTPQIFFLDKITDSSLPHSENAAFTEYPPVIKEFLKCLNSEDTLRVSRFTELLYMKKAKGTNISLREYQNAVSSPKKKKIIRAYSEKSSLVLDWVCSVLRVDPPKSLADSRSAGSHESTNSEKSIDLVTFLRDGVHLCKLICAIDPTKSCSAILLNPAFSIHRVVFFLEACRETGIQKKYLFTITDPFVPLKLDLEFKHRFRVLRTLSVYSRQIVLKGYKGPCMDFKNSKLTIPESYNRNRPFSCEEKAVEGKFQEQKSNANTTNECENYDKIPNVSTPQQDELGNVSAPQSPMFISPMDADNKPCSHISSDSDNRPPGKSVADIHKLSSSSYLTQDQAESKSEQDPDSSYHSNILKSQNFKARPAEAVDSPTTLEVGPDKLSENKDNLHADILSSYGISEIERQDNNNNRALVAEGILSSPGYTPDSDIKKVGDKSGHYTEPTHPKSPRKQSGAIDVIGTRPVTSLDQAQGILTERHPDKSKGGESPKPDTSIHTEGHAINISGHLTNVETRKGIDIECPESYANFYNEKTKSIEPYKQNTPATRSSVIETAKDPTIKSPRSYTNFYNEKIKSTGSHKLISPVHSPSMEARDEHRITGVHMHASFEHSTNVETEKDSAVKRPKSYSALYNEKGSSTEFRDYRSSQHSTSLEAGAGPTAEYPESHINYRDNKAKNVRYADLSTTPQYPGSVKSNNDSAVDRATASGEKLRDTELSTTSGPPGPKTGLGARRGSEEKRSNSYSDLFINKYEGTEDLKSVSDNKEYPAGSDYSQRSIDRNEYHENTIESGGAPDVSITTVKSPSTVKDSPREVQQSKDIHQGDDGSYSDKHKVEMPKLLGTQNDAIVEKSHNTLEETSYASSLTSVPIKRNDELQGRDELPEDEPLPNVRFPRDAAALSIAHMENDVAESLDTFSLDLYKEIEVAYESVRALAVHSGKKSPRYLEGEAHELDFKTKELALSYDVLCMLKRLRYTLECISNAYRKHSQEIIKKLIKTDADVHVPGKGSQSSDSNLTSTGNRFLLFSNDIIEHYSSFFAICSLSHEIAGYTSFISTNYLNDRVLEWVKKSKNILLVSLKNLSSEIETFISLPWKINQKATDNSAGNTQYQGAENCHSTLVEYDERKLILASTEIKTTLECLTILNAVNGQ